MAWLRSCPLSIEPVLSGQTPSAPNLLKNFNDQSVLDRSVLVAYADQSPRLVVEDDESYVELEEDGA